MGVFRIILKSAVSPVGIVNSNNTKETFPASFMIVVLTSVFGSLIAPLTYYLYNRNRFEISLSIISIVLMFILGILTWFAACTLFLIISKLYNKGVEFREITATWGFSYVPNLVCIIMYNILQTWSIGLIQNNFIAVLINTFFIMLLVWKTIYYFIEMRYVLKLNSSELLVTTLMTGMVFLVLMGVGFAAGIEVPML